MDYQLNIYPSSERDLMNVKADNITKQIKMLSEQKLPQLYKKSFSAAVKKYNERAISGKLIDDYYKSICASNIPEVYKLSLVIRYELLNKTEIAAIQKAFFDFKKALEKETFLVVVSAYVMSFDEFKELQIFFYPVCDGYVQGLGTRADLIDVTKKLYDQKENMNIIKAMPMFIKKIDDIFRTVHNGEFISQEELEAMARNITEENPLTLHAIAVETLKAQMNALQQMNAENQKYEMAVQAEKDRIINDLAWAKETEKKIYKAEQDRIEEERRKEEAARRAEEARRILEAQRKEEARLREEERRLEAERLAEQARRNVEMMKQLAAAEEAERQRKMSRQQIGQSEFGSLIEQHLQWQELYGITEEAEYDKLPDDAKRDPRRLSLHKADINSVSFDPTIELVAIELVDCEFTDCHITFKLTASSLEKCVLINTDISDSEFNKCVLNKLRVDGLMITNVQFDDSTIMRTSFKDAILEEWFGAPATSFIKCDFTNTQLKGCDMKKNAFMNCDFTETSFISCDLRDAAFQVCKLETMKKEGCLFRGAKFNAK